MTKKQPAKRRARKPPAAPTAAMEAMLRQMEEMLMEENGGPIDKEDWNALAASLGGPSAYDRLSRAEADAKDEAQQIAFDAMEAETEAQARKLAKRALKLDPDCVDALTVLVDLDAHTAKDALEGLQKVVAAGERSLGEKFITEYQGNFWMLLETRPYMRAMDRLAGTYRSEGINLEAVKIYEKMLRLNPEDNQGVRDPLLGLYLEIGDLTGATRLLDKYKDDASSVFAWARVLERFLAGDQAGANAALAKARKANRYMEQYLTGRKPLPNDLPEMYSIGSKEEAVLCLNFLMGAWIAHQEAMLWLLDRLAEAGVKPVLTKATLKRIPVKGTRVQ